MCVGDVLGVAVGGLLGVVLGDELGLTLGEEGGNSVGHEMGDGLGAERGDGLGEALGDVLGLAQSGSSISKLLATCWSLISKMLSIHAVGKAGKACIGAAHRLPQRCPNLLPFPLTCVRRGDRGVNSRSSSSREETGRSLEVKSRWGGRKTARGLPETMGDRHCLQLNVVQVQ